MEKRYKVIIAIFIVFVIIIGISFLLVNGDTKENTDQYVDDTINNDVNNNINSNIDDSVVEEDVPIPKPESEVVPFVEQEEKPIVESSIAG